MVREKGLLPSARACAMSSVIDRRRCARAWSLQRAEQTRRRRRRGKRESRWQARSNEKRFYISFFFYPCSGRLRAGILTDDARRCTISLNYAKSRKVLLRHPPHSRKRNAHKASCMRTFILTRLRFRQVSATKTNLEVLPEPRLHLEHPTGKNQLDPCSAYAQGSYNFLQLSAQQGSERSD